MNSVSGLALVITATWVLMLGETYILFGIVRPMYPNIHEDATSAVLKIGAAIVLGVVWVAVMLLLRSFYVRRVTGSSHGHAPAPPGGGSVEPQK